MTQTRKKNFHRLETRQHNEKRGSGGTEDEDVRGLSQEASLSRKT